MDSILSVQNKVFTGDGEEFTKVPRAVTQAKSFLYRQCSGVWQSLWRSFMESLYFTPHRCETNGIAERAVRRVKEGTSAVLLQSGLDEKWWAGSAECYCCLRNVQDVLPDWEIPWERRFGKPFKGPIVPFGAMVENHPISARDQFKTSSIWQEEGFTRNLSWVCIDRGRKFGKRRCSDCGSGRIGKVGRFRNLSSKNQRYSQWQMVQQKRKRRRIPRSHSKAGTNRKERRFQERTSRRTGRVSTDRIRRWRWSPCRLLVDPAWFDLSSSQWISSSTLRAEGRNIPCSNEIHWCNKVHSYWSGRHARKNVLMVIGMSLRTDVCRILWKDSQNSLYWKRNVPEGICGPVRGWQKFKRQRDQIMYAWSMDKIAKATQNRENKNGKTRSPNSTMLDDWGESTALIRMTKNKQKLFENARRKLERPMDAAMPCKKRLGPATGNWLWTWMHLTRFRRQSMVASWNPMHPEGNEWNLYYL